MEKLNGKGIPGNRTVGEVGQWYEDTETGDIYECRIANKYSTLHGAPVGGYVWELRMRGEDVREFHGESGVSSWNDLTDKPFYENIEKETVVISQKTFTPYSSNTPGGFDFRCVSEYDRPEYMHDICVIFDNKLYQCTSVNFTYNSETFAYVGNLGLAYPQFINGTNNIDTHLPFLIKFNAYTSGDKYFNDIYVQDEKSEHTIEVFVGNYDMKPIESKYVFGYPSVKEGQTLVVAALNDDGTPCEFAGADVFSGSWTDLTDKPFGETVTIGDKYIERQEITTENNNVSVSGTFSMGLPTGYSVVVFDETQYVAETIYKIPPTQNPEIIVGNPSLITEPYNGVPYEDNGLPFAIYYDFRTRKTVLLTQNNETAHTIEAYMASYEFKELDDKFIPDTIARTSDIPAITTEDWTFTLEDDSVVTKKVVVMSE